MEKRTRNRLLTLCLNRVQAAWGWGWECHLDFFQLVYRLVLEKKLKAQVAMVQILKIRPKFRNTHPNMIEIQDLYHV